MIAVRPDARNPLAWQVLCEVVAAPGEHSSRALAAFLLPWRCPEVRTVQVAGGPAWERLGFRPPRIPLPTPTERAELARRQVQHMVAAEARVARLMSRLQSQGLIERRRSVVTLSEWFRLAVARLGGITEALEWTVEAPSRFQDRPAAEEWSGGPLDDEEGFESRPEAEIEEPEEVPDVLAGAHGTRILWMCLRRPTHPDELNLHNGAAQRAYTRLAELGVIHPPSHRWPTSEGTALVRQLSRVSAPPPTTEDRHATQA